MEDRNCTILFEYLRSILYDTKVKQLDIDTLDAPYQKLGKGMQYLSHAILEMENYSAALSKGVLSDQTPSRENRLCENLKNIHANLNHLTWQAKQVAKGDYTQNVSYLGEFSEAFNTMTAQLAEREQSLKREAEMEKNHAYLVDSYNQLLLELIGRSKEEILVTSTETGQILYSSKNDIDDIRDSELHQIFLQRLYGGRFPEFDSSRSFECNWEAEDSLHRFYKITTGLMEWQGENAYAHIILNVTDEKLRERQLESEAYNDPLTGIGNRHFFALRTQEILLTGGPFILCYCDLDHLKHVNDCFGHLEGDNYLRDFVNTVRMNIRKTDIFARLGGDEFCILMDECTLQEAQDKFADIQEAFNNDPFKPYPKNFSIGMVEVKKDHAPLTMEDIIAQADAAMYDQKRIHHLSPN